MEEKKFKIVYINYKTLSARIQLKRVEGKRELSIDDISYIV
jgi:hypothetical protein